MIYRCDSTAIHGLVSVFVVPILWIDIIYMMLGVNGTLVVYGPVDDRQAVSQTLHSYTRVV